MTTETLARRVRRARHQLHCLIGRREVSVERLQANFDRWVTARRALRDAGGDLLADGLDVDLGAYALAVADSRRNVGPKMGEAC